MLSLSVKVGESITLGASTIKIAQRSGQSVRLVIDSDERVRVNREGAMSPRTFSPLTKRSGAQNMTWGLTGEMMPA